MAGSALSARHSALRRVVLTGGPGAGKTVVSAAIARAEPARFVLVPEAATQVYDALRTRWDLLDREGRRDVQRRIYRLQREQEERLGADFPGKVLLLDRGTIDGAAYWPGQPDEYWRELHTSWNEEYRRYDAVIWLESSAALGAYDGMASNPYRFEDAGEAIRSGERLLTLWKGHPEVKQVGAFADIRHKVSAVRDVIRTLTGNPADDPAQGKPPIRSELT
jgi:predicted ATPase